MNREEAVNQLKEICKTMNCSNTDSEMCKTNPYKCSVVRLVIDNFILSQRSSPHEINKLIDEHWDKLF